MSESAPETEVSDKATRRRFTAEYKRRVLLEAERCQKRGELGDGYLAIDPEPRVHALVAIGSPLRWLDVHPLLQLVFASPRLVGTIGFSGSRHLARKGLRLLTHYPRLLSVSSSPTKRPAKSSARSPAGCTTIADRAGA